MLSMSLGLRKLSGLRPAERPPPDPVPTGTPSTTKSGSLLALIEVGPRTRIVTPPPGSLLSDTWTPGTLLRMSSSALTTRPGLKSAAARPGDRPPLERRLGRRVGDPPADRSAGPLSGEGCRPHRGQERTGEVPCSSHVLPLNRWADERPGPRGLRGGKKGVWFRQGAGASASNTTAGCRGEHSRPRPDRGVVPGEGIRSRRVRQDTREPIVTAACKPRPAGPP